MFLIMVLINQLSDFHTYNQIVLNLWVYIMHMILFLKKIRQMKNLLRILYHIFSHMKLQMDFLKQMGQYIYMQVLKINYTNIKYLLELKKFLFLIRCVVFQLMKEMKRGVLFGWSIIQTIRV